MNRKKTVTGLVEKLVGSIFLAVGIFMLVMAVTVFVSGENFKKNAQMVSAVISDITKYRDSDGDAQHDVTVKYYVNGKEYEVELNEYSSSMYEGQTIDLYVDKEHLGFAKTAGGNRVAALILSAMGVAFAGVGGGLLWMVIRRSLKRRRIMRGGVTLCAEVTGGVVCHNYSVNGRHPYKLDCKYEDVFAGNTYFFRSDYVWEDPQLHIGQQIKVYVNPENMSEYVVDVESLSEENGIYDFR